MRTRAVARADHRGESGLVCSEASALAGAGCCHRRLRVGPVGRSCFHGRGCRAYAAGYGRHRSHGSPVHANGCTRGDGSARDTHAVTHAVAHSDSDTYSDPHSHANRHACDHAVAHPDADSNTDSDTHAGPGSRQSIPTTRLAGLTRLGRWKTNFTPSNLNGDGANIRVPAKRINGTILKPGESFNFIAHVLPITEPPYHLGGLLKNGQIIEDGALGGGMCSASTTLFNAAMRAGLPDQ